MDEPGRGDLAIPLEMDRSSHQSLQHQFFELVRHLPLGWILKHGYGCPSQALAEQLSIFRNNEWPVHDRLIAQGYLPGSQCNREPT